MGWPLPWAVRVLLVFAAAESTDLATVLRRRAPCMPAARLRVCLLVSSTNALSPTLRSVACWVSVGFLALITDRIGCLMGLIAGLRGTTGLASQRIAGLSAATPCGLAAADRCGHAGMALLLALFGHQGQLGWLDKGHPHYLATPIAFPFGLIAADLRRAALLCLLT